MWLASRYILVFWCLGTTVCNFNSRKLGINIDSSNLDPVVPQLKDTSSPSIVLTLDVSASMEYKDRIKKLGNALHKFIQNIPNGLLLGMVEFSTHENLLSKLTLVDATTRKNLELKVPSKGQGETCIGCGVRLALQELGNMNGTMVLVADGQNTVPDQFISDVQADVVQSGTKVISVGFGDMAPVDDMRQLANASGGLFFCVSDEDGVQGLLEAFKEALKLAKPQVEKTTQMTENWTTEDTRLPTDLPVSSTLSGQQHTTVHQNFTNSHIVPGKPQTMSLLWLIIGIVMAVVGGAILLAFTILLIRKICAITHARGTYSVVKRNHETA